MRRDTGLYCVSGGTQDSGVYKTKGLNPAEQKRPEPVLPGPVIQHCRTDLAVMAS